MSGIMLNILAAGIGGPSPVGFLAAISNSNGSDLLNSAITLRSDQINLTLQSSSALGESQLTVLRLDSSLSSITWQTSLTNPPDSLVVSDVKLDSAGNAIVVGSANVSPSSIRNPFVAKFNSSGALQWQRRINNNGQFLAAAIDASDNPYCVGVGQFLATDREDIYVARFDSSGGLTYQRNIGRRDTSSINELAFGIAFIDANFILAARYKGFSVQFQSEFFIGTQSTGETVSAINMRAANGTSWLFSIATVAGETASVNYFLMYAPDTNEQILRRYTVAGGFVYTKSLFATSLIPNDLCMDANGTHIYVCGVLSGALQLSKFVASTGALAWQRSLSAPTVTISGATISVDSLDNIHVNFTETVTGAPTKSMVLKMPGSGAGSGNSVVIEGKTYTYSTTTFSSGDSNAFITDTNSDPNVAGTETLITTTLASAVPTLVITDESL
jgi:hypothetical protein